MDRVMKSLPVVRSVRDQYIGSVLRSYLSDKGYLGLRSFDFDCSCRFDDPYDSPCEKATGRCLADNGSDKPTLTIEDASCLALKEMGYDGLYRSDECACSFEGGKGDQGMFSCGEFFSDCVAGYRVDYEPNEMCPCGGGCTFHIMRDKPVDWPSPTHYRHCQLGGSMPMFDPSLNLFRDSYLKSLLESAKLRLVGDAVPHFAYENEDGVKFTPSEPLDGGSLTVSLHPSFHSSKINMSSTVRMGGEFTMPFIAERSEFNEVPGRYTTQSFRYKTVNIVVDGCQADGVSIMLDGAEVSPEDFAKMIVDTGLSYANVNAATKLALCTMDAMLYKTDALALKHLKNLRIDDDAQDESLPKEVKAAGLRLDGSFSPPYRKKVSGSSGGVPAFEAEAKIKGFSSVPSINAVLNRIKSRKDLTPSQHFVRERLNLMRDLSNEKNLQEMDELIAYADLGKLIAQAGAYLARVSLREEGSKGETVSIETDGKCFPSVVRASVVIKAGS